MKIKDKSSKLKKADSKESIIPVISKGKLSKKKKKAERKLKLQAQIVEELDADNVDEEPEYNEPKPKKLKKKKKLKKVVEPEPEVDEDEDIEEITLDSDGEEVVAGAEDEDEMEFIDESRDSTELPFEFANDLFEVPEFPEKSKEPVLPHMKTFGNGVWYRKLNSTALLVAILPETDLYFTGKASVIVLKGIVSILGHELSEKDLKRTVYSPKGHSSLLCISAISAAFLEDSATSRDSFSEPDFLDDDERPFERIISLEELQEMPGAAIVMEGFEDDWCDGIRRYATDGTALVGPRITGIGTGNVPKVESMMDKVGFQFVSPEEEDNRRFFHASEDWPLVFDQLCEEYGCLPKCVAIFGGKGVGKSTFTRWLVNRGLKLTSSILYIDLDPGQPEFTPAGLISVTRCSVPLLGPNFTHLQQPLMSVFVGSSNVGDQPLTYFNALKQIWAFVSNNDELRKIPWVINTMGFTQGLGVDFACETIKLFHPNGVIQIGIQNDRRCFPFPLAHEDVLAFDGTLTRIHRGDEPDTESPVELPQYLFIEVESACSNKEDRNENQWGINAKELRENTLVSYFANVLGSNDLLSIVPTSISLDKIAIGTVSSRLLYPDILKAMNGNLIALCTCPLDFILQSEDDANGKGKVILNKTGFGVPNICHGYGIVRAIDMEKSTIFVITPLPSEMLQANVNSLVCAGSVGMPLQFYSSSIDLDKNDPEDQEIPYLMSANTSNSKLHTATKRQFIPNRVAHTVLKNCLA